MWRSRTFQRLYQRHPNPEPEFNTGGWLVRVATNLGLHSIRSFKRRQGYELAAGKMNLEQAVEDRPAESTSRRRTPHGAHGAGANESPSITTSRDAFIRHNL